MMLKNAKLLILCFIVFINNPSCTKKEAEDKKSPFYYPDSSIKADKDLEDVLIKLPKQQQSFKENQNFIENILKKYQLDDGKIDIKKMDKLLIGFNLLSSDKFNYAPIIDQNFAYILSDRGNLTKINLVNKKKLWKKKVFEPDLAKNYQIPKISLDNGIIYAVIGSNKVVAVNSSNGQEIWSKLLSSIPISKIISDGDLLYFITLDNKTFALSKSSGEIRWVHYGIFEATAIFGAADPVIYKDQIIASYSSGEVYLLNKKTGQVIWYQDLNLDKISNSDFRLNDVDATPKVKNGVAYLVGNGGLMMAIKIDNQKIIWRKEISSITNFTIAGDFVFIIDNDNKLLAIHRISGKVKWIRQLPDLKNPEKPQSKIIYNGVWLIGDKIFITDVSGKIYLISPFDGKTVSEFNLGAKIYDKPVIANNKIYFYGKGFFTNYLIEAQ